MQLFLRYVKQKLGLLAAGGVFVLIFAVSFFLYHLPVEAVAYPAILCAFIGLFLLIFDFLRTKRKHGELAQIKTITDAMAANFPVDETIQNKDYREIIRLLCEEHTAYQTETNRRYAEMIDYYTVWAHQIKTPIASMRLTLQNEDSPLSRRLTGELFRIEQYVRCNHNHEHPRHSQLVQHDETTVPTAQQTRAHMPSYAQVVSLQ